MNPDATIQPPLEPAIEAWWAAEPEPMTPSLDLLQEDNYLLSHENETVIEPLVHEAAEPIIESIQPDATSDETIRPMVAGRRATTIAAAVAGISALLGPQVDEAKDIWSPVETTVVSVEQSAHQSPSVMEASEDNWTAAKFITAVESMPTANKELPTEVIAPETSPRIHTVEPIYFDAIETPSVPEKIELAAVTLPFELLPSDPEAVEAPSTEQPEQTTLSSEVVAEPTESPSEYLTETDEVVSEESEPRYPTVLEPIGDYPEMTEVEDAPDKTKVFATTMLALGLLGAYARSFFKIADKVRPQATKPAVPVPTAPEARPMPTETIFETPVVAMDEVVSKPRKEIVSHRKPHQLPRHAQKSERRELTKAGIVRRSTGWLPQWLRSPVNVPATQPQPVIQKPTPAMPAVMSQGMPLAVAPPPPVPPPFVLPTSDE